MQVINSAFLSHIVTSPGGGGMGKIVSDAININQTLNLML
jgi:hypothetical protein